MVEFINIIAGIIMTSFGSSEKLSYIFEPMAIHNEQNSNRIFARLDLLNLDAKRKIVFTIYPREQVELEIFITNLFNNESLDLRDYIEFKKGKEPHYYPAYTLNKENIVASTNSVLDQLHLLLNSDLKSVIEGIEWINIPTYDPRDQSNYH